MEVAKLVDFPGFAGLLVLIVLADWAMLFLGCMVEANWWNIRERVSWARWLLALGFIPLCLAFIAHIMAATGGRPDEAVAVIVPTFIYGCLYGVVAIAAYGDDRAQWRNAFYNLLGKSTARPLSIAMHSRSPPLRSTADLLSKNLAGVVVSIIAFESECPAAEEEATLLQSAVNLIAGADMTPPPAPPPVREPNFLAGGIFLGVLGFVCVSGILYVGLSCTTFGQRRRRRRRRAARSWLLHATHKIIHTPTQKVSQQRKMSTRLEHVLRVGAQPRGASDSAHRRRRHRAHFLARSWAARCSCSTETGLYRYMHRGLRELQSLSDAELYSLLRTLPRELVMQMQDRIDDKTHLSQSDSTVAVSNLLVRLYEDRYDERGAPVIQVINHGGAAEMAHLLEILLRHPTPARWIARFEELEEPERSEVIAALRRQVARNDPAAARAGTRRGGGTGGSTRRGGGTGGRTRGVRRPGSGCASESVDF